MFKFLCELTLSNERFELTSDKFNIQGNFENQHLLNTEEYAILVLGEVMLNGNALTVENILAKYQQEAQQAWANLEGHFAILILDLNQQLIHLVSDKFTTHPIYYFANKKQIIVSSTLSPLTTKLSEKPAINPQAIYNYIYFHCIPSPLTIYQDVAKIEPAQVLTWQRGAFSSAFYWRPEFNVNDEHTENEQHKALQRALKLSVERYKNNEQLGAFLSGGLDSSTVAGNLAQVSSKAHTFTIGFSEKGYDETEFAQAVADHFGTEHHVYQLTPKDVLEALPLIAAHYDEPFGNSSALPTYFCAKFAKSLGIQTLLAGDGGDELFAGNERYATQKVFEKYFKLPGFIRATLDFSVPKLAKLLPITLFTKANSYITQANQQLPTRLQYYNFLHQNKAELVFTDDLLAKVDTSQPLAQLKQHYQEINVDSTNNMLYLDWKFTLADNDLVKVNNMTDFGGISVKYPMLSPELLNLSCQVSAKRKLPGNKLRDFYKKALMNFLPDSTINKDKQGFGLPFGKWLAKDEELAALADSALENLKNRNLIRPEFIELAKENHRNVHAHYYGELVWIMVMLELWLASHE